MPNDGLKVSLPDVAVKLYLYPGSTASLHKQHVIVLVHASPPHGLAVAFVIRVNPTVGALLPKSDLVHALQQFSGFSSFRRLILEVGCRRVIGWAAVDKVLHVARLAWRVVLHLTLLVAGRGRKR